VAAALRTVARTNTLLRQDLAAQSHNNVVAEITVLLP
jgi:hypothetical protein